MSVAMVGAGIAAVGTISNMGAAGDAADAQAAGIQASNDTQMAMFNKNREDQAPWRDAGKAGLNKLSFLLGLPGGQSGGGTYSQTAEQIRNELLPAFTSSGAPSQTQFGAYDPYANPLSAYAGPDGSVMYRPGGAQTIDEAGLSAAIMKRMEEQKARAASEQTANQSDPAYGSLLRKFSAADLNADPVYQSGLQFGLNEGVKGLNRQAAAGGNFLSGAALKALTRFGNDYGSTKANESYNRYTNDQTNTYNKLAGISGTGQTSAAQIASQGAQVAQSIGNNAIAGGNARASGYINQSNSLNDMLGGVYGAAKRGNWFSSSTPDFSSYTPDTNGWAGSYTDNPFQANGL